MGNLDADGQTDRQMDRGKDMQISIGSCKVAAPRLGTPQCLRDATSSCGRQQKVPGTEPPPTFPANLTYYMHALHNTHIHTLQPPAHRGGPPCGSPVTLPGTRQVAVAEWARKHRSTARGPGASWQPVNRRTPSVKGARTEITVLHTRLP